MSEPKPSFFVVKRKANEEEVSGGKRLRLIGSYTQKPSEHDIVASIGKSPLNPNKRAILQDIELDEFRKILHNLPKKKSKRSHNLSNDEIQTKKPSLAVQEDDSDILSDTPNDENKNPLFGLNLTAEDFSAEAKDKASTVEITCNGEKMVSLPAGDKYLDSVSILDAIKSSVNFPDSMENCIYDVYSWDISEYETPDLVVDFDIDNGNDIRDEDSDENDEHWRGNDYPDDADDEDDDEDRSQSGNDSDNSYFPYGGSDIDEEDFNRFGNIKIAESDDDMKQYSTEDSD